MLFQPWLCATMELDPEWLRVDNIERRAGLSVRDFREQFEAPNLPVVLTDGARDWPALKKWDAEYLAKAFEGKDVIAGNYKMSFQTYLSYCNSNRDELPLYLFDKTFCRTAPRLQGDFSVPPYFAEDLFSVLGEEHRPDYRCVSQGDGGQGLGY